MADKAELKTKEVKKLPEGFYKSNTTEIEINGKKVRVFSQEADLIKKKLAAKSKK